MEQTETDAERKKKLNGWQCFRRKLRFAIFRRDNFTCQYCGRTVADRAQLELEHIIPLSKGGEYSEDNLVTSCHECNAGKGDEILTDNEAEVLRFNPDRLCEGVVL